MTHDFHLADIGEGLDEAEIIEWKVAVGDTVQRDQPLVEVMTDKSNAELPSPVSGVVVELGGAVGELLEVGALVARIEAIDAAERVSAAPVGVDPAPSTFQDASRPIGHAGASSPPPSGAPAAATPNTSSRRPKASPSTRAEAARRGIDLTTISGTGPGGRILLADLDGSDNSGRSDHGDMAAPRARPVIVDATVVPPHVEPPADPPASPDPTTTEAVTPAASPAVGDAADGAPDPAAPGEADRGDRVEPLRGMRRAIALNMARSWSEIPHIHLHQHIDAEPLLELRRQLRASDRAEFVALTPLTFFVAAVAQAMAEHPQANATLDLEAGIVTHHGEINVGVAVAADQGLVVPVVRHAAQRSFADLAIEVARLVTSARLGDLPPAAYRGGTVTITNFGSLGGEQALPLIRPPESAIFGFGSIAARPFVVDDRVVARNTMHIVLGADHRLLDGDVTTAMLARVADLLTAPIDLVLDR